jgi:SAM-dependent methyltransferase
VVDTWLSSDLQFDYLYPPISRTLSRQHWSPLEAVRKAVEFLVPEPGVRVLDIGSGVGKFCLAGAYYKPEALFFGVEQRKDLVEHALMARKALRLGNVSFIHQNFTTLDLKAFDHFYFYNSFYENLRGTPKIDHDIPFSKTLYNYYNRCLFKMMEQMPAGTRVVTRCSWEDTVPSAYVVVELDIKNMLKYHIKK